MSIGALSQYSDGALTLKIDNIEYLSCSSSEILTKQKIETLTTENVFGDNLTQAIINVVQTTPPETHQHSINDIYKLNEEEQKETLESILNNKSNNGHTHDISEINDLQDTLNNKSNNGHTHDISEINDWSEATNDFAKTNTDNIFTGYITSININTSTNTAAEAIGENLTAAINELINAQFNAKKEELKQEIIAELNQG